MDVAFRAATLTDIGELARLRWQLYTEREQHDEPMEAYVERFTTFAHDALSRDDWRAWCAETDGRVVAAMWLHTVPRVPAPGHGDPADRLPDQRVRRARAPGERAGSRMIQELVGHCASTGFELVLTFPADDSYGFYGLNGFIRPPDPVVHRLGR